MGWMQDEAGLERCAANHVPLTPLSHLARAARVFPDREALVYGSRRWTYAAYHADVSRMAGGLAAMGIAPGDVVATLIPNLPGQVIAHFGVPAAGAVLNTINIRLEPDTVSYILGHGGAKILIADSQFIALAETAIATLPAPPILIEVQDDAAGYPATGRHMTFDDLLARGAADTPWIMPVDEWESLALNYTSGTTGRPKGVVYHHRGAYLMTMGTIVSWRMTLYPRLLTIVPLFHCNSWNHTWMLPVLGGCVVCCRDVTATAIYAALADEGVGFFGGAPIVLNLLVNAVETDRRTFAQPVEVFTAGAPPAAATLAAIEKLGFNVTHVYGLTETYGHVTECLWNDGAWDDLSLEDRAARKARQGVEMPMMEHITVVAEDMSEVPADATTQGEIVMRGNSVMKGYYRDPDATAEAFKGGYFHSGDLAVRHPDGHMQIVDRAKDIIISGGENVSSVEIEGALMHHPAVSLCAVVAQPDDRWGEVPCAFIELKRDAVVDADELIAFVRTRLAGFKVPKRVVFGELPKTSTGKIQKFELRAQARTL
ncbi:AMP-binding protein [Oceaniovalibus sp. ACAM 378]|uniref:AMP-binding protein n=1 Tax=Oceaniovalibus sp. ACAM 378 TaxID=2599923 RepID=UPI0011D611C4|nr:AMP-binding protein [Oceaniovalibus sp. ACAM 378]TYB87058.1 AMP-binding protein [Oceaniovalibus sp. ACAM 378]